MIIRPALLTDYNALVELATPWMARYPLTPDFDRIRSVFRTLVSSSTHYAYVSQRGKRIEGALLAVTNSNAWARKSNSSVLFWTGIAPGAGARLLRHYRDWVLGRPMIRVAGFAPDLNDIDPRAWTLAERIGFEKHGGSYVLFQR